MLQYVIIFILSVVRLVNLRTGTELTRVNPRTGTELTTRIGGVLMRLIAFVGPTGTGKSYRALWVAKQKGIDYIIDDGLLIGNNKVIAGISAKKEATKLAATRRACFFDEDHVNMVKGAIEKIKPEGMLILATSENMAKNISKALSLGEFDEVVAINDVATDEEIKIAQHSRRIEGKHVIPVPTFELKKTFSGYFIDKLKIFKKKDGMSFTAEKSVIRPTFSYMGKFVITDSAIKDIVRYVISQKPEISRLVSIEVENKEESIEITLNVIMDYSKLNKDLFAEVQEAVKNEVERLTLMNVVEVNLRLKSVKV